VKPETRLEPVSPCLQALSASVAPWSVFGNCRLTLRFGGASARTRFGVDPVVSVAASLPRVARACDTLRASSGMTPQQG
jgi:hypothetical protein